jgi:hypothetical protein
VTEGFDLSAFRTQSADEEVKYFPVHLGTDKDEDGNERDVTLRIPPLRRWPLKAQDAFSEGKVVEGIRYLVGDEDAELFEKWDWTFGEFEALFEALSKWSGFQAGQLSVKPPGQGLTRT